MNSYLVFKGEYPFDEVVGVVIGEDDEQGLANAIKQYGRSFPHPVIEPLDLDN